MNFKRYVLGLMLVPLSTALMATNNIVGTHIFGFATSFNDSTVYFTEIQYVDSAFIGKSNFLIGRDNYSYQLQTYLQAKGITRPTCVTTFAKKQEKIEKKYLKMRKRYEKKGKYNIKFIPLKYFMYKAVVPQETDIMSTKQK